MARTPEDPLENPYNIPLETHLEQEGFAMVFIPSGPDLFSKQVDVRMRVEGKYQVVNTGVIPELSRDKERIGMFIYDSSRGEIVDENFFDSKLRKERYLQLKQQGWNAIPSSLDRILFYRPIQP